LDEVVLIQRPYYGNSRLRYKKTYTKKGLSSITTKKEEEQNSDVQVIRVPMKKEECKYSKENIWAMERTQKEYYKI
jgi:hypothetical protein